jgi:8-oxo-dGTP pyrophosphatase MutT (NUDIX family)
MNYFIMSEINFFIDPDKSIIYKKKSDNTDILQQQPLNIQINVSPISQQNELQFIKPVINIHDRRFSQKIGNFRKTKTEEIISPLENETKFYSSKLDQYIPPYLLLNNRSSLDIENKNLTLKKKYNKNFKHTSIKSYGFICLKNINNKIYVLLVRRKFTVEFTTFVMGRYSINNLSYLKILFRRMTFKEKKILENESFYSIWNMIWYNPETKECLAQKYKIAYDKFISIYNGFYNDKNKYIKLNLLIKNNKSQFDEPDWTLPKGKKERNENTLECAKRELNEETNLNEKQYNYLDNIYPLFEIYKGSDGLYYKHIYFVAIVNHDALIKYDTNNKQQITEIGDIRWFTIKDALNIIRTNNSCKREMFRRLKDILNNKYPNILKNIKYS